MLIALVQACRRRGGARWTPGFSVSTPFRSPPAAISCSPAPSVKAERIAVLFSRLLNELREPEAGVPDQWSLPFAGPQPALNPYSFVGGDPIDFADPSGATIVDIAGIFRFDLSLNAFLRGCLRGVIVTALVQAFRVARGG